MSDRTLNAQSLNSVGEERVATRDQRYKELLTRQLGVNGINLLLAYSFIVIVSLLLVILSTVGYASTLHDAAASSTSANLAPTLLPSRVSNIAATT